MKLDIVSTVAALLLLQSTTAFVAPSSKSAHHGVTALSLFGMNGKKTETKTTKVTKKKQPVKKEEKEPMWKKTARLAVTGSADGVSLLGKPQHNWRTGKKMTGYSAAHNWNVTSKRRNEEKK
jgi:hypothetical protein